MNETKTESILETAWNRAIKLTSDKNEQVRLYEEFVEKMTKQQKSVTA